MRLLPDAAVSAAWQGNGFAALPPRVSATDCAEWATLASEDCAGDAAGTRSLLLRPWCQAAARRLRDDPALALCLPADFAAVQCTYFEKSAQRNWLVAWHQDLSIPVAERSDDPALRGWCDKEGALFVQPPRALLAQLVAVRLHLDDCTEADGPLRVVPGSHLGEWATPEDAARARELHGEVACPGLRGSVLAMRPLLLHASSKARGDSRRRVLHFLFGPRSLPHGLRWQHAV